MIDEARTPTDQTPFQVVVTGRPNVGKSTIFNRIVGRPLALVEATPGVTRDRLSVPAQWAGQGFVLTDTGGLGGGDGDPFSPLVAAQAEVALRQAAVVVFVVDAASGLLPADQDLAGRLRRLRRPVVLIANKVDRASAVPHEFYALGLGEPFPVSATRGEGLGDALDRVVELLAEAAAPEGEGQDAAAVAMAIVGRPNVGKSSLVNRLVGEERLITSQLAGTTRDAVDVPWEAAGRRFVLVDTPGLRRPSRIDPRSLERDSARRSTAAIARATAVALVCDATDPCTDQDKRIGGLIHDRRRAALIILNKADLIPPGGRADLVETVREAMPFLAYAPICLCSALTGWGTEPLPQAVAAAADAFAGRLPTAALNQCLRAAIALHPPAAFAGKPIRIYYAAQIASGPPRIALIVNRRGGLTDAYLRHLENRLRARFPLEGTPIRWAFRERQHRQLVLGRSRESLPGPRASGGRPPSAGQRRP